MTLILAVLVLTFAAVVVLTAPVRLICRWEGPETTAHVRWLGLIYRLRRPEPARTTTDDTDRDQPRHRPSASATDLLKIALEEAHLLGQTGREVSRLFKGVVKLAALERGRIELMLGTPNPAGTGMLHGALWAMAGIAMARWPQLKVVCIARFNQTEFSTNGELVFRLRPWQVLGHLAVFIKGVRWRELWKLKKEVAYS